MARRDGVRGGRGPARGRAAVALLGLLAAAPAAAEALQVAVDHAKVIRMPEGVATVVVGNPGIADVSVQKSGVMVVTGKAYGSTNLIALDAKGTMLGESTIHVEARRDAVVVVQRGLERESYSCTPHCMPTLSLGDSPKHFDSVTAQAGARNGFAVPKGP